jgi:nitroreductase
VRAYKPDLVGAIGAVLEAARLAPTTNRQSFQIVVIHTAGRDKELQRIYGKDWFTQAPLLVCICSVPAQAWVRKDGKSYAYVDVAIAMDHLILAAANLGLGTCWVAGFDLPAAREFLRLPEDVEPIAFTPLGYPADQPGSKDRKELSKLVRYEHW